MSGVAARAMLTQDAGDDEARDGEPENQRYRRDLSVPQGPQLRERILVLRDGRGKAGLG
jgi:hypothetical protein